LQCAVQVFIAAPKKLVRSFCGMWRTEAMLIAAHGVSKKSTQLHIGWCVVTQIKWRKDRPNRGLAFDKPSEDQQVASGGMLLLLQLLL
jgi:hypothetical protein